MLITGIQHYSVDFTTTYLYCFDLCKTVFSIWNYYLMATWQVPHIIWGQVSCMTNH